MMPIVLTAVSVFAAVACVGCVLLWRHVKQLRHQRDDLQNQQHQTDLQHQQMVANYNAQLEQQTQAHDKALATAQQQSQNTFKALAGDVLKQANEQFLLLAKKSFQSEQQDASNQLEKRKLAIENLVKPLREVLDKYNQSVHDVEKSRKQAYGSMSEQLKSLIADQRLLRGETANLVTALRRPEVRGRWGELQLRRVAELAGMIEHCDFTEQTTVRTDAGIFRPDMVINLPSERKIIIDAKTPIDAYLDSLETTDDIDHDAQLQRHVRNIETQVKSLASKQYQAQFDQTPDFVVLFIPGESFLQAAVQVKPALIENAMQLGVVIASPTTLITLLKAVAMGWREQRITENAKQVGRLGVELHERIAKAAGDLSKLGEALNQSVKRYNTVVGTFDTRIVSTARKFKELGADSKNELPAELETLETAARPVKSLPQTIE